MVWVEIDDEAWDLYKKSWALLGVKTHAGLVRMLEIHVRESSLDVLDDADNNLISDEPEALVRRASGMIKDYDQANASTQRARIKREKNKSLAINPPPADRRCECCGRHITELKPFGGPGDPLVGDFAGALLVKKFRPSAPILNRKELERYRKKHGDKNTEIYRLAVSCIGASWECRDCIILSDEDYFNCRQVRATSPKSPSGKQ